jgi:hypothetical protein
MEKQYEAPELTVIGQTEDVVMGLGDCGEDAGQEFAMDFEFELD